MQNAQEFLSIFLVIFLVALEPQLEELLPLDAYSCQEVSIPLLRLRAVIATYAVLVPGRVGVDVDEKVVELPVEIVAISSLASGHDPRVSLDSKPR